MSFFESEMVQQEMKRISELQEKIYTKVFTFASMDDQDKLEHIEMLEELLKKLHFECEEHTADHLMHILDPEHVGYLGRKEIAKYILLEHNKTNKVLVTKSTTLKSSVKVEVSSAGQEGSTQVPYT